MVTAVTNELLPSCIQQEIYDVLDCIKGYSLSNQDTLSSGEKLTPASWNMFDFFSKSFLHIVMRLGGTQSSDLLKFQHSFQKFREIAFSQFCTSSEEKGTIDTYHNKIFQREEKAIKDLAALEQQLQVEREERARAFSRYQVAEQHLHQEELVKEEALEAEQQLETEFNILEEHESKSFNEEESKLVAKCTELKTLLKQLQVENRENELSLRGKKEQSADEVTNLLREYDHDIKARNEDLQRIHEDHKSIQMKLEIYQNYFKEKELKELKTKEEERLKIEIKLARQKRREDAVVFIQFAWRRHQRRKHAKESLEKKDKGKQGKKGNKGATSPSPSTKKISKESSKTKLKTSKRKK